MKVPYSLFLIVSGLTACTNSNNNSVLTDHPDTLAGTKTEVIETLCFEQSEGTSNRDTSYAQMVINGQKITGVLATFPYEKDSRVGTIFGTKEGDLIKAVWIYMQEGIPDTLDVEFKLDKDQLLQKSFSVDTKTGRQFLSDSNSFSTEFHKIDCNKLPQRLH